MASKVENDAAAKALRIAADIIGRDERSDLAKRYGYEPPWFKQAQRDAARLRAFALAVEEEGCDGNVLET